MDIILPMSKARLNDKINPSFKEMLLKLEKKQNFQ